MKRKPSAWTLDNAMQVPAVREALLKDTARSMGLKTGGLPPSGVKAHAQPHSLSPTGTPLRFPRTWSRAVPTVTDGIRFPSKMEARVYGSLKASLKVGDRLYRQVRFPLLSIAPTDTGVPLAFTVDFVIVGSEGWRVVDAKGSRKSREWERGKRAFEACYGLTVEEVK